MSEIDAKVNMSLDEIIKMEKKEKKKKIAAANGNAVKHNRNAVRGRPGFRGKGSRIRQNIDIVLKKKQQQQQQQQQIWQRNRVNVRGSFTKNRFRKNSLARSRSNLNLNLNQKNISARGTFNVRRSRGNRFGLIRSKSRSNLTFNQGSFFMSNKSPLKRTSSLPNLRDPNSVHNRLGYQTSAQIAYRNRVKRAKQLLLQRQNQRMNLQNRLRLAQSGEKTLLSMQPRIIGRQQILTSQRRFTTGGLRSDQIARAQRLAQFDQKLMRLNAQMNPRPSVNFMCTLGNEYTPSTTRQRPLTFAQSRHAAPIGSVRQLSRGRSPYRQNMDLSMNFQVNRSRSCTHNTATGSESSGNVDDRSFSEIMYSLAGNLTGRTLNDRFSF